MADIEGRFPGNGDDGSLIERELFGRARCEKGISFGGPTKNRGANLRPRGHWQQDGQPIGQSSSFSHDLCLLARSVRTDRKRTCRRAGHARIPAQVSRGIDRADPVTVAAPGGQSRVVVARPGTRPQLHKTCAPRVLPHHKIARHLNVVRWRRPTQVDLAHTLMPQISTFPVVNG